MADQLKLPAEKRTEFGKGAARRIRRADKVPAVLYGHGTPPLHLSLPGHDAMLALRHANAVLTLDVEGETHMALAKDVQRDPIKRFIEHVDLVVVRAGEKVTVEVGVHLEGEAAPETLVTTDHSVLEVEAPITSIPEWLMVSVEGLEAGTQVLAGEVELPEGVTLVTDPEALVVNVSQQLSEEAAEAELAEAEAEAGIEQEESDDEAAEGGSDEGESAAGGEGSESDSE
ncbi:50S ribosomal protein L25/general stress protein Ctc [Serinicoccus sediminis]|uniref:50S ribosomal protein L25/general stress protein Ctc n=1 Tax=Serinicoccus sediminis TaxID=2306021 RepID=UPI0010214252|nr:50S ribosomal protein L25/general stress protein Ctc [Serinicoccus sediminis]